jgi:hypothetical protein
MKHGFKNANKVHLSQKRTCGRIDRGAGVYGGCHALNEGCNVGWTDWCGLGFAIKDRRPLEPCYKPITQSQYVYVLRLMGKIT